MFSDLTKHSVSQKRWLLIAFIVLLFVHVASVFLGFYGNDDINYARHAANIASQGNSYHPVTDQFLLRWSTVYGTAFFYKLFGVNDFTSALCAAISLAGCGWLLYKMNRPAKGIVFLFSATLFFWSASIIFYSHRLLPDATMCFAILWMYFAYRSFLSNQTKPWKYGIQFSIAFLLALVTKETLIIALPLFLYFLIADIFGKKNGAFWRRTIILSVAFFCAYLLYFKISTGDFLYRYHILLQQGYLNECSFDRLPFSETLKRIGYELWRAMLLNGDFLLLIPAIGGIVYRKKLFAEGILNSDISALVILLCCANFMTISFTSYVPLCHDPRHFLFILPFAALTGGPMLYVYFKEPRRFFLLPVFSTIATVAIFWVNGGNTKYLYALFTVLLFARPALAPFAKKETWFRMFAVSFVLLFSINYWMDFVKPRYSFHKDQKKIIQSAFVKNSSPATVIVPDAFSAEMGEYFLGFKNKNIHFVAIDSSMKRNDVNLYMIYTDAKEAEEKTGAFSRKNEIKGALIIDSVGSFRLVKLIK